MNRSIAVSIAIAAGLSLLTVAAHAEPPKGEGVKGEAAKTEPVSGEPRETSAAFGDWVVRCDRPSEGHRVCEAAQSLMVKGQQGPIAQIAFGHAPAKTGLDPDLTLTVLLPPNVSFAKSPRLGVGAGAEDRPAETLAYRRCLPGGCLADAKADTALMTALRGATTPGHLVFTDAADRTITLPLSLRGLPQALEDLARETGRAKGEAQR